MVLRYVREPCCYGNAILCAVQGAMPCWQGGVTVACRRVVVMRRFCRGGSANMAYAMTFLHHQGLVTTTQVPSELLQRVRYSSILPPQLLSVLFTFPVVYPAKFGMRTPSFCLSVRYKQS